ncbi:DUF2064 domain-containing protein [Allomuricauda sp. SCSIO 65647]|uniref:TIGR04282 family arsenosugar biosynthesis glycosyltransferase n=1 Tax=Allomuricauda sp. SCSIO 65647 TaxID=2908843 RepID=UPI001F28754D|nr:DUF2064 domain-containing protein [Muricauda sp. SCSIO 65647]UJH69027.1 DUF2064 domain-containing protein [Muricauda sp. SCSIO 65647]
MQHILGQKTAVLVFANSAKEEVKHKPIRGGAILFDELTKHTLGEVKKTKLPFFHFTEQDQTGATFGQRFSNAIQHLFNLGFEQLITVGNDSPQLRARHILEAHAQIKLGKNVLGPSNDGGFYLMALHHRSFDKKTFGELSWQTRKIYHETIAYFKDRNFETVPLTAMVDIDSLFDIKRLAYTVRSVSTKIRRLLMRLIVEKKSFHHRSGENSFSGLSLPSNRGSPLVLALSLV